MRLMTAERVFIKGYSQLISLIGDKDATTRRLLEDILSDEFAEHTPSSERKKIKLKQST